MTPADDRRPVSESDLVEDLRGVGVAPGSTLIVHSSLSAIGWVIGGPGAVVRALLRAVGPTGTLAMPAATPSCADPATWTAPPRESRLPRVREHLPLFDPATTPSEMGAISETFRGWPGTLRSDHPLESVCANGASAGEVVAEHPLEFSEGPGTPFGKLDELGAQILLLGVGFNRCTALHHAETLSPHRRLTTVRFPGLVDGERRWVEAANVADDNDRLFPLIGRRFIDAGLARHGRVGLAECHLFEMAELVRLALPVFEEQLGGERAAEASTAPVGDR